jgi:hypothetical protein
MRLRISKEIITILKTSNITRRSSGRAATGHFTTSAVSGVQGFK